MGPEPSTSEQSSPSTRVMLDLVTPSSRRAGENGEEDKALRAQPSVAALTALGIKVRDFGYESKLLPIAPFVRRQIQPGASVARALKRARHDGTAELEHRYTPPMSLPPENDDGCARKLRRMEMVGTLPLRREGALLNLEPLMAQRIALDVFGESQSQGHSQESESQLPRPPYPQGYSHSISQDSGESIPTPPVTPNGSLQWTVPDSPTPVQTAATSPHC